MDVVQIVVSSQCKSFAHRNLRCTLLGCVIISVKLTLPKSSTAHFIWSGYPIAKHINHGNVNGIAVVLVFSLIYCSTIRAQRNEMIWYQHKFSFFTQVNFNYFDSVSIIGLCALSYVTFPYTLPLNHHSWFMHILVDIRVCNMLKTDETHNTFSSSCIYVFAFSCRFASQ